MSFRFAVLSIEDGCMMTMYFPALSDNRSTGAIQDTILSQPRISPAITLSPSFEVKNVIDIT